MFEQKIYTVSEVTRTIKLLLEENIPTLWLEGEVSNYRPHYSGHLYFTLKDENAQISAVMWSSRAAQLTFQLADGLKLQVLGNIRVFERSGRYQIDIIKMQPAGLGRLQMEFEQLKQKLNAEGLFAEEHKQTLPAYPEKIGIITSPTGAAVRDMIHVLRRRAPHVEIILRPARVQGEQAAPDIAEAVREFNRYAKVDLLIVGRGGGSIEDLWAFNEEVVARAIFESKIPVISAVGHEIDFTISDFVADLRGPTPSAAAELAVPDFQELSAWLKESRNRMITVLLNKVKQLRELINHLQNSYGLKKPEDMIRQFSQHLDMTVNRMQLAYKQHLRDANQQISGLQTRLNNLDPENTLKRGYTLTYQNGALIKSVRDADLTTPLESKFWDGTLISTIDKRREEKDID